MFRTITTRILLSLIILASHVSSGVAQRNLKDIPDPSPEIEKATFIIPEGFEVNLFASDPQLAKPIHMNFDDQGQLWVASSEVYPQIKPGQPATDKIIILKDSTGDGKADQRTVFVDNLLIPTGVLPGDGGVYVANSTDLIHYRDTDNDGIADRTRIVLSGFGTEDTHHLLHTLRWGPDGAMYMNQSIYIHSHVETPAGVQRLLGGGIWRFRPETMELEIFCRGFVNPWGHHFDYWGQSFATDGAFVEGINYVFPGAVYRAAPNEPRFLAGLNPGSPKHCGLEILSGRHLPKDWQGTMVTNDFRGNRVCRFKVSENGAGYASNQVTEVIKSSHVAFRPIDVKMGPDGAIYVADWYNPIIQHGEVDFRDQRRDHTHGRIWRITAKDRPLLSLPNFSNLTIPQLLDLLESPENWVRLYAKLHLKTRDSKQVIKDTADWVKDLDKTSDLYAHNLVEAMWALQNVLHVDSSLIEKVLTSPDPRARTAALRLSSVRRDKLPDHSLYHQTAVQDEHPRVRLEAVRALAENHDLASVSHLSRALSQPMDRFLDFAVWRALRDNRESWLPSVQSGEFTFGGDASQLLFALRSINNSNVGKTLTSILNQQKQTQLSTFDIAVAIGEFGDSNSIQTSLSWLLNQARVFDQELAKRATLDVLDSSIRRKITPTAPDQLAARYAELKWDLQLLRSTAGWNLEARYGFVYETARADSGLQAEAIRALGQIKGEEANLILSQLTSSDTAAIRTASINALSEISLPKAVSAFISDLGRSDTVVTDTLPVILGSNQGRTTLLKQLEGIKLPADNAKRAVSLTRSTGNDLPTLIAAFRKAGNIDEAGWVLTEKLKLQLIDEIQTRGNPHAGQQVYRRKNLQCMQCHAIGGAGGKVGPDLISIGASAPVDYLIESLLSPNSKIKENFHAVQILDNNGKITTGIIIQSDDNNISLRTAKDEIVSLARSDIDLQKESRSLMPDGTVDELTRAELVDLVAFLTQLGKIGDFSISKQRYGRSWQALQFSTETHRVLNRNGIDSAAKNTEVFQWEDHYATVQGFVPTDTLPQITPHTADNPFSFLRSTIEVTQAGALLVAIQNPEGILLWINGKPTPLNNGDATIALKVGTQQVVIAVQHASRQSKAVRINTQPAVNSQIQYQWNQ